MGCDFFRFKQFIIKQSGAAMKVGVDSVLLGVWAFPPPLTSYSSPLILDVGTGTGLLALMMAQRFPNAIIDAVEIDNEAHQQAVENATNSPWNNRIRLICDDFFNYAENCFHRYNLIICNPPYFTASLKSPNNKRSIARHNDSLPHSSLLVSASKLLTSDGMFAIVLPTAEAISLINEAKTHGLFLKRMLHVQAFPSKPVHRIMLELSKTEFSPENQKLCIEKADRSDYTEEYKQLTKDFYLKF